MEPTTSPYMLLFHDSMRSRYADMSPEQRQQLLQQWNAWYDGLIADGRLQQGHPLEPEGRVVSGPGGERVVDGPFAESKEAIAGYFFLNVSGMDEATEIAKRCPGLAFGITVEVRPVAECCPVLKAEKERLEQPELASV
jgi:hypothetical protein